VHGLHAGAAGQQLSEQVLAGGTQPIKDVADLLEALLVTGFAEQCQNGVLGDCHLQVLGQARRRGQRLPAAPVVSHALQPVLVIAVYAGE